jgi:hypothetical protein
MCQTFKLMVKLQIQILVSTCQCSLTVSSLDRVGLQLRRADSEWITFSRIMRWSRGNINVESNQTLHQRAWCCDWRRNHSKLADIDATQVTQHIRRCFRNSNASMVANELNDLSDLIQAKELPTNQKARIWQRSTMTQKMKELHTQTRRRHADE